MQRFYQYNKSVAADSISTCSFYRVKGQEWPSFPGLLALSPKRPARGREADRLVVYLTLSGNIPFLPPNTTRSWHNWTDLLPDCRFADSAVRAAARWSTSSCWNAICAHQQGPVQRWRLILGVMRGAQFTFAQCGPTHVFCLSGNTAARSMMSTWQARPGHQPGEPGLFRQVELNPGDLLMLSPTCPPAGTTPFKRTRQHSPEACGANC